MSEQKRALRETYLQYRKSLPPLTKSEMDARIFSHLLRNEAYITAQTVFCYVSLPHEIDTRAILAHAWQSGKRIAVPRCRKNGRMDFYIVSSSDDLTTGMLVIDEPKETCTLCLPQPTDLCIVPCLAMDEHGFRLGYGGGYYDRYLSAHPVRTLGLCCESCIVHALPTEEYDVPIQLLVSDKED